MGYDLVSLDRAGRSRLAHAELLPAEQAALEGVGRAGSLPIIAPMPGYWGKEWFLAAERRAALALELDRVASHSEDQATTAAVAKLRSVLDVASRYAVPLHVVPD